MSYSTLPSKADGDYFTLGMYNQVKDNFDASAPAVYLAKGDLYGGSGAAAGARLAVGANDATLVADSSQATGLAWQIQPGARLSNSVDLDPTPSSWVALTFDTEAYDTDGMHSTVTNTNRLTVPSGGAGVYLLGAAALIAAGGGGAYAHELRLQVDGSTVIAQARGYDAGSNTTLLAVQTLYSLAVGQYVEVQVNVGADVNVAAADYSPLFFAQWLRRP